MFKFKRKSANNNVEQSYPMYGAGCNYINANTDTSPNNLLLNNKSFVYACSQKVTQYLSSIPIHTYYYTDNPEDLLTDVSTVPKRITKSMPSDAKMKHKGLQMVEIEEVDHPLNQLIVRPAKGYGYSEWISVITSYLLLLGNALLEIKKKGGKIEELVPLKWEFVYPFMNNGVIEYYNYQPPNENGRTLQPDEVVHIRNRDAGNLLIGKGNLEACMDSSALYNYYDAYATTLAKNYAMPGVALKFNQKVSNHDEAKKLAQQFSRKFGANNNGKPICLFGEDVDITPLSITPKDMEYEVGRKWALKTIAACFGIPEDLITTENSNNASSKTAIEQFITITCYPLLNKILQSLNTNIVEKYYDKNAYWFYDNQEILEHDQSEQATILNGYIASGVMTVNEARTVLDLPPLELIEAAESEAEEEVEDVVEDGVPEEPIEPVETIEEEELRN